MSFKQRLNNSLAALLPNNSVFAEYHKRSSSGKKAEWNRQAITMSAKEIKHWKNALASATDPENPRRGDLMRFYENLLMDLHLGSCIDNRILPVQCAPNKLVDKNGNADKEAKKLLERPWYLDAVKIVCEHTFEGAELMEMFDLNEKGELKEVTKIPQSNFLPQKGIIVKDEYDDNGVSYKEGVYKDYYIQIGNDWNLGMLNQLAIIVIAKKLGLGAWMSYVEKYGVPPIFAITDRMDTGRRDELFEMLSNFKMNHFAVLQGTERIETPQGYNVDAHNTFKSLMSDVCNEEMTKRIQGGTGTSDAKSFVGSAEVHERLLKYRHMVDKLLFKFYFNEEIKPRLVKLSPVYAVLENLTFEWDETENLTIKELLEAIKGLSAYYEFDVAELAKITGLPITKIKSLINAQGSTEPDGDDTDPEPQKKKPKKSVEESAFFSLVGRTQEGFPTAGWNETINEIARQLHEGTLKPEDLNRELILQTYNKLNTAAEKGYGSNYNGFEFGQNENSPLTQAMRNNLFWFSGAKTYNELQEMNSKLIGEDGRRLDFEKFKHEVKKVHETYNEHYLNAEYMTTNRSAEAMRDWEYAQKNKAVLPNLKYHTMQDDQVRDEHAALEGIVKPIDSPWWSTHMPPNGFCCRCYTEPTAEPASAHTPTLDNLDYRFANNPGQTGEAFTVMHPYFSMPKEQLARIKSETELTKLYAPYRKVDGVQVWVNDFADRVDLKDNLEVAKLLAQNESIKIKIRPHINAKDIKNPEYYINNKTADLKKISGKRGFENGFRTSQNQQCKVTVFKLEYEKLDIKTISNDLNRVFSPKKLKPAQIEEFYLVYGEKSVKITKQDVLNGKHMELIEKLKGE